MARDRDTTNEVKLRRPRGFYIADNETVDLLAAEIGIFAFGVYHLLMRLAEGEPGARISQRDIAARLGISTDSARNAIATLKQAGLIEEVPSERSDQPSMYLIVFAKDVVAARAGAAAPCAKFRTRIVTRRVRNSGHAVCEIQDASDRNSGRGRAKFRTPNKEVNKNINKSQTTPQPPLQGGGIACSLDASRESNGNGEGEGNGAGEGKGEDLGEREPVLSAEEQAELDEVNAIRARMGRPQAPLSPRDFLAGKAAQAIGPVRGTDPPGGRRFRRRRARAGR